LSISASTLAAASTSRLLEDGKLEPEVILNATLAGGVALGACCDMIDYPVVSIVVGAIAGTISALGFLKIAPYLKEKMSLSDTCGVNYLHGIPSILGCIVSAIVAGTMTEENVRKSYESTKAGMWPLIYRGGSVGE